MEPRTGGRIALGCGLALVLLSCLASGFFGFHVFFDPRGAISDDEAAPGLVAGGLCFFVSLTIAAAGGFFGFRQAVATGMPGGMPGGVSPATPSSSGSIGVFVAIAAGLLSLLLTCAATGAVPYFQSERERWERMREEDYRTGADPLIIMIDDGAIRGREENMYASAGAAACCGFTTFALFGLAGFLHHRARRTP